MSHVIVIGAGMIGASIACRLARAGQRVTVLDAGPAAGAATGASFGWINASFFLDEDHYRLRRDGIAAWHDLSQDLGGLQITWSGTLWWEEQGAEFDALRTQLQGLGYPVEELSAAQFAARQPGVTPPAGRALHMPDEGVAESAQVTRQMLAAAAAAGAEIYTGVAVRGLEASDGRITGVHTAQGQLQADQVVVAAGIGTARLLADFGPDFGLELPLLSRPGVTLTTAPLDPFLNHIMVAPGQEFRQLPDGRILAPTSAKHQQDPTSEIVEPLGDLAGRALARLQALMPGQDLRIESTTLAARPVPGDGFPVVGPAGPEGLYLSVLHSGVTLAAVVSDLAVRELMGQGAQNALGAYRLSRFQGD